MENETTTAPSSSSSSKNKMLPIIAAVVLILILGGGYFFYKSSKKTQSVMPAPTQAMATPTAMMTQAASPSAMEGKAMGMQPATPAPLTDAQKAQIAAGPSKTTTKKAFTINGGNFYFSPNNITVNKGDTVTVTFTNDGGTHNWILDEFNAKTPTIKTGESSTITFTADKVGTFEFYCGIGSHRQLGMKGNLIVQ